MITKKRAFGNLGEEITAKYLKSKGYVVLSRNYLKSFGELDIVASKEGIIHFIEVKSVSREIVEQNVTHEKGTRVTEDWNPAERVDKWKLKRLERAIHSYLLEFKLEMGWQIDVALVYIDEANKKARVEMLESVI